MDTVKKLMPVLCLDLDGTVRYSKNGEFVNKPEDVVVFPDVEKKLWEYRERGWYIAGASNQGGVAFDYKTDEGSNAEVEEMLSQFEDNPFHEVLTCFSHEKGMVEPWCHRSLCRKPNYGMLALIEVNMSEQNLIADWDNSIMVGDRLEDKMMANHAGVNFELAWRFFGREEA